MKSRIKTLVPGGAVAVAVLFVNVIPGAAQSGTIDFDDLGPGNGTVPAAYGSTADLSVSNAVRSDFGNAALASCGVGLWVDGYSDLNKVGYSSCLPGGVAEFFFNPNPGVEFFLSSMQFGSYEAGVNGIGPIRPFTLQIFDGSWNSIFSQALVASSTLTVMPNVSSTNGMYVQWGTDWDVGIDNIEYTLRQTSTAPPTSTVPEPISMALLGTGLGVVAAARRRKRNQAEGEDL